MIRAGGGGGGSLSRPALPGFTRIDDHYCAANGRFDIIGLDVTTVAVTAWDLTATFLGIGSIPPTLKALKLGFLSNVKSANVAGSLNRFVLKAVNPYDQINLAENVGMNYLEVNAVAPAGTVLIALQAPPIIFIVDPLLMPSQVVVYRALESALGGGAITGVRLHGYFD